MHGHHNTMKAGTARLGLLALLAAALALPLCLPQAASAELTICTAGEGAGQCGFEYSISAQRGLAVDQETGHLYVADRANNRIDVFAEDGSFLFAFGWKVDATTPEEKLQTCTAASGCLKGSAGSGAGQLSHPGNLAVDNDPASPSYHDLYVSDAGNLRVQRFDPGGEFIWMLGGGVDKTSGADLCTKASGHSCGAGAESEAEGAFASPPFVGVGPGGILYALDNPPIPAPPVDFYKVRLQRFQPSGALIAPQTILLEGYLPLLRASAVDPAGDVWIAAQADAAGLRKYSPGGSLLAGPIDAGIEFASAALTSDNAGNIYAGLRGVSLRDGGTVPFKAISMYDSSGAVLRRFAYAPVSNVPETANQLNGLAARSSALGDVYLSEELGGIRYVSLPPPGPLIPAASVEAKSIGNAKATLFAEVNPEGSATEVHFDYLTQKAYEEQGDSFAGPQTKSSETKSLGASGFDLKATEALIGCPEATKALIEAGACLQPETTYRYRVIAKDSEGHETEALGGTFTTKPPLEFGATYVTEVGSDSATLKAELNPLALPTTAYFEYVDDARFQQSGFAEAVRLPDVSAGAAPLDFGKGEALTTRSAAAFPLEAATTYHYRLIATDPLLAAPRVGAENTFTTFGTTEPLSCPANEAARIGPGALLPDCRAYELVSPIDKGNADILAPNVGAGQGEIAAIDQGAASGQRLTYSSYRAFGDAQSAPYTSQYLASRDAEAQEWVSHGISPPRSFNILSAGTPRSRPPKPAQVPWAATKSWKRRAAPLPPRSAAPWSEVE